MTRKEALKVGKEMSQAGFTAIGYRHYPDGVSMVDATDKATGIEITISTTEQWEERKQAIAFSIEYEGI